jgi:TorA maturation chaperone TorD
VNTGACIRRSELYSFLGNSLLKIMTPETSVGLDPAFWESFAADFGLEQPSACSVGELANGHHADKLVKEQRTPQPVNKQCGSALASLRRVAYELSSFPQIKAIERVGVEYTRLFVGPGTPTAPPWETLYREGGTVLFGQPTIDMRRLFSEAGVQASSDSHQFEDHLGFELLYLAMTSARLAELPPGSRDATNLAGERRAFIQEHPLSFIEPLYEKAREASEERSLVGYYSALLELVWGVLLWDLEIL